MIRLMCVFVCINWLVGYKITPPFAPVSKIGEGESVDIIRHLQSTGSVEQSEGLTAEQKRRTEQLISLFENDTTLFQYGYSEELKDGHGITAGRIGFATADGDLLEVVSEYSEQAPKNPLARYLPRLRELAKAKSGDISSLEDFHLAWAKAARDPKFVAVQDEIVDRLYYQPAMKIAENLGLKSALGKAIIYDTLIQHGNSDDPDGLPALLIQTKDIVRGTPKTGIGESNWLYTFLKARREALKNPHNRDVRDIWKQSSGRCDVLIGLVQVGNFELVGPLTIHIYNYDETVP